jgi:arylsulfatase A-like enzyme
MSLHSSAAARATEHQDSLLALALCAGIITGFLEVAAIAFPLFGPDFAKRSSDAVWMIPAFDGALFALLGLTITAIARLVRVTWQLAAGCFAGLGAVLVLLLFPSINQLATLIVAAAVGIRVAQGTASRPGTAARVVRRSLPWLAGSVCVIALAALGWRATRERWLSHTRLAAEQDAPNVLLLILDTVRASDLSLYGYARRTTPELERFAAGGAVFDLAFAPASWTAPSHASMFTGHWPLELDVTPHHGLGSRWPTLAEVLRDRGYATGAFVANQIYAGWESGLSRGFEHFDDYPVTLRTVITATAFGRVLYPRLYYRLSPLLGRVPRPWRLRLPPPARNRSAEKIIRALCRWLDDTQPAVFFAFLNFMDAHPAYAPPDSFRHRFSSAGPENPSPWTWSDEPHARLTPTDVQPKLDVYDASIAYLDSQLGVLFRELKRRGLLDRTLVVVAGDHGEEFAEHGFVSHGYTLYRPSVHVPLVLRLPGSIPEGQRVASPVSLRNLAATVLGIIAPSVRPLPGRSLARFWTGEDTMPDTIVTSVGRTENLPRWYPVSRGDLNSIAFDGVRYIRNEGDGTEELYDFEHDVLERWNLLAADSGPLMVPRYRAALARMVAPARRPAGK